MSVPMSVSFYIRNIHFAVNGNTVSVLAVYHNIAD